MYKLITNARLATMDARAPFAEAAVINGDRFAFVGSAGGAKSFLSSRTKDYEELDMGGRLCIPGFNDSHMHYLHYIKNRCFSLDLSGATSFSEMLGAIRSALASRSFQPHEWLVCEGWNQDKFSDERRFPTADDLDAVSRDVPIIAMRVCFHIGVLNSRAMELIGLDAGRAAELGECAGKRGDGSPNGVVKESVFDAVKQKIPMPDVKTLVDMLIRGQEQLFALGITSIQSDDFNYVSSGDEFALLELLRDAAQSGELKLRMSEQCLMGSREDCDAFFDAGFDTSFGARNFGLSCIKLLQDGSLGARTALISHGYEDAPGASGLCIHSQSELNYMVAEAQRRNMPAAIHAIGDKALAMAIDAIEAAKLETPYFSPPHAVVHCQISDEKLLRRMAQIGAAALVQPVFIDYDMDICADRVGGRLASTSYAWNTLRKLGVVTSFGTDCPVEDLNPMRGLWCAVTRQKLSGSAPFNPEEAMDLYDALYCYTAAGAAVQNAACAKGKLCAGMYADFAVLDRDILALPAEEILQAKVAATYVGGMCVYEA